MRHPASGRTFAELPRQKRAFSSERGIRIVACGAAVPTGTMDNGIAAREHPAGTWIKQRDAARKHFGALDPLSFAGRSHARNHVMTTLDKSLARCAAEKTICAGDEDA